MEGDLIIASVVSFSLQDDVLIDNIQFTIVASYHSRVAFPSTSFGNSDRITSTADSSACPLMPTIVASQVKAFFRQRKGS